MVSGCSANGAVGIKVLHHVWINAIGMNGSWLVVHKESSRMMRGERC